MLELVLEDLRRHRLSLCKELERAASRQSGSDYIDCWNRIDEIGEHDRRIGVLMDVIAENAACQCCDPCNVLQATLKSVRELPLGSARLMSALGAVLPEGRGRKRSVHR